MNNEQDISSNLSSTGGGALSVDDFKKAFGEDFVDAIDINTWSIGANLSELYPLIESEWLQAKTDENKNHKIFREKVFPRIREVGNVPFAGLHDDVNDVKRLLDKVHRGFLFNGAVTACGSTHIIFNTVPLTITQIGICLVNYERQHGSYSHRLFRRDLRFKGDDPIQEALDLIEKRRSDDNVGDKRSAMSNLAVRGIKAYTERAILLEKKDVKSKWLLGNGNPAPYELMTGFWGSKKEMKDKSIALMSKMILEHQRFVYVHSCDKFPDLWTLGNALLPFEYLIIGSLEDDLIRRVELGGTRGVIRDSYADFAKEVGSKIVRGIYRVSRQAPPQIFYGHIDHIRTAALIAMADSVFQLQSGSPMLLDLASNLCQINFSKNDLLSSIQQASIKAEVKLRIVNSH
ncbi:MAG: hypothetical protein J0I84_19870 [Terrimonas sp.]|nr:hypothetical protein [Terrimonas sp.]OJY92692.1 MAG: hypothetical protein BGP13_19215 [Sphingobacteriales bacterium 40-81]